MLGTLPEVYLYSVTATVSRRRVPVWKRVEHLLSEKKAKRLICATDIEAVSIPEDEI